MMRARSLLLLLAPITCAPSEAPSPASSSTTTDLTSTSSATDLTPSSTSSASTSSAADLTDSRATLEPTTGAPPCIDPQVCPPVCDTVAQDCPRGEKCTGVKPSLHAPYAGTACVPDNAGQGAPPGSICINASDGSDTCDAASMCVQFGSGEGACVPFCAGPQGAPTCGDPSLVCARTDHLWPISLCVQPCDPLAYDCPDAGLGVSAMVCAPAGLGFGCVLRGNLDGAGLGAPCDDHRDCIAAALCAPTGRVAGCEHPGGCCAAYCDLDDPAACTQPAGHDCNPYYAPGEAPPGLAAVGLCTLP